MAEKQCFGTSKPKQKSVIIMVISVADSQAPWQSTGSPPAEGPQLRGSETSPGIPGPLCFGPLSLGLY